MSLPHEPIRPGAGLGEPVTGSADQSKSDVAKEQASKVTAEARQRAGDVAQTAKAGAGEVAGNAKESASHVAGVAKDEARQVADQAGRHVQSLFGQAREEFTSQAGTQQRQIASTLASLGRGLEGISFGDEPADALAGDLARQASARLGSVGTWLEQREPAELLHEVRRFARRRPGAFLAAAALTGLVAGRLTRGAADEARQDDQRELSRYRETDARYVEQGRYGYADQARYGYVEQGRYADQAGYDYTSDTRRGEVGHRVAADVQPAYGEATADQPAFRGDAETTIVSGQGTERPGNQAR